MVDDLRYTKPTQTRWQHWLIEPLHHINDAFTASQSRRLSVYLLVLAIGTVINFLIWWILGTTDLFTTLGMILSLAMYGLSRLLRYKTVALATVLLTIALPFILLIFDPANFNTANGVFLISLALLTSSQFLSLKSNLQLVIVMVVLVIILNLWIVQRDNVSFLGVFVPLTFLLTLNLLNAHGYELARQRPPAQSSTAFNLLPDAVIIHNDNHILASNESASCLLGIPPEQLIGRRITDFISIHSSTNSTRIIPGRQLTIRYEDVLYLPEKHESIPIKVTARSIPYDEQLATMMILQAPDEKKPGTFHQVANLVTDYAYALTLTHQGIGDLLWCTDSLQSLINHEGDNLFPYDDWLAHIHADDREAYIAHLEQARAGHTDTLEYRFQGTDNRWVWMHDTAHLLIDPNSGQATQIIGMSYDVSERVEAEKTLEIHIVQQAVVAELGLLALNSDDTSQMIEHIAVLCEQVLDLHFVAVFEHQLNQHAFYCRGFSQSETHLALTDQTFDDTPDASLMGYTLHTQEAVTSTDLLNDARFHPLPEIIEAGYVSGAGIIILGQSYVPYGVLAVFSRIKRDFTYDEVYFLQAIANVLGTFIERHRAQQAEREQAEFAEALRDATSAINSQLELPEVLAKIIRYLQQVIPHTKRSAIILKDYKNDQYRYHTTWNFPAGEDEHELTFHFELDKFPLLQDMADDGQPIIVNDTQQDPRWIIRQRIADTRAYLGAPIIVRGDCIGFINLHSFEINAFDEDDAQRLQTFAETIGTAIVNARKQDYLEREVLARTAEANQQREQLQTILSGTGDGIFYTENELIAFANQTLCDMTGYRADELQNQLASMLYPTLSDDELERLQEIQESLKKREVWRGKGRIQCKDGSVTEVGLTISQINGADTSVNRAVIIVRDIRKEQELEQLQKQFIAAAAHDLRSPIASLLTRMHMIRRDPEHMDQHMKRLDYVIGRMNRLVNDLIDANGRISLHPQTMILQDVLGQVVDLLRAEAELKGLTLNYDVSDKPILVLADPHRLEQVFVNLITNAIHYTEQGTIRVRCHLNEEGTLAQISVQDTGIGIPKDEQKHIFLPFYRTRDNRSKGSGLGLSITREIIELHNGKMQLTSTPGEGSIFNICLPVIANDE